MVSGPHREQRVVIPVNGINRAVVQAVNFGRTLASDVRAVYVTENPEAAEVLRSAGGDSSGVCRWSSSNRHIAR